MQTNKKNLVLTVFEVSENSTIQKQAVYLENQKTGTRIVLSLIAMTFDEIKKLPSLLASEPYSNEIRTNNGSLWQRPLESLKYCRYCNHGKITY